MKNHCRNLILFLHDIYLCTKNKQYKQFPCTRESNKIYKKTTINLKAWKICVEFYILMPKINWNLMNFPLPFNIKKSREKIADFSSAWFCMVMLLSLLFYFYYCYYFGISLDGYIFIYEIILNQLLSLWRGS